MKGLSRKKFLPSRQVLLPGFDGIGWLFEPLVGVLPSYLKPLVIAYPVDKSLGYIELLLHARGKIPTEEPFVLLAESFSGALAVRLAATNPSNPKEGAP